MALLLGSRAYELFGASNRNALLVVVARTALSGLYMGMNIPCVFANFSKSLKGTRKRKLHDSLWYVTWHTVSFSLTMYYLTTQAWFWKLTQGDWSVQFLPLMKQECTGMCQTIYWIELGNWLACSFFILIEPKRKDFGEMCLHHATTIALIILSYSLRFTRVGLVIVALHDISDIFLYLAKSFSYLNIASIADTSFVIFTLLFVVTRIIYYPIAIVYQTWTPWIQIITGRPSQYEKHGAFQLGPIIYTGMPLLLTVLFGLHCFWLTYIAKSIIRRMKSDIITDDRSDDESDAVPEKKPTNGKSNGVHATNAAVGASSKKRQ